MSAHNSKFIVFVWLCLAALLIWGCLPVSNVSMMPVRTFTITIDKAQRQELLDQLQNFADKHEAKYAFSDYGTTDHFLAEIWGESLLILAGNVPGTSDLVDISFYGKLPGHVPDEELVDEWLQDLKSFISEIPDVMITEVRKSFRIMIDRSQRKERLLLTQMQKLADEHSLEFSSSVSSVKTSFHGELHGEGFHITSETVTGSPREVLFTFFIDYYETPTSTSLDTVDELFYELQSLLVENLDVMIFEAN
jgi:hypothetical protein